jgi:hypothetical protein
MMLSRNRMEVASLQTIARDPGGGGGNKFELLDITEE